MQVGRVRGIVASLVVCMAALVVLSGIQGAAADRSQPSTRQGEMFLIVGGQDEMKTRNLLPAQANDVWTSDVHYRAYASLLLGHPVLDQPMAYIAKGVDVNENNIFEAVEYDQWRKEAGTNNLTVVVYYDFNGVFWHDGEQMSIWDAMFSYHVNAQNARFNTDLRVLYCSILPSESYESCGNQLNIQVFDVDSNPANGYQKNWENEGNMAGDDLKRVAVRFTLNQPFALFYESTLFPIMLPMHEWSRTYGGRHSDFGCAVWIPQTEADARGIPACGNADSAKWGDGIADTETVPGSTPYQYTSAETWVLQDQDLIGHGPFEFDSWVPSVEAKVVRYERYYTGVDPDNPTTVYDPQLSRVLTKPTIDGIRYKVYRTTQLGVFALQAGPTSPDGIDFYHWNVGAEFVPELLKIPEIAVEANAEPGFFYLAYNFRLDPWGYKNGDPAQDVGFGFRQAVSHLINKKGIVQTLLQNFGVIGHGVVSPSNTFWYNDNIPKPDYNLASARAILDDLASPGGQYYQPGYTTDPPGVCSNQAAQNCRGIGARGTAVFEILTPQTDYDPVRATSGAWIADAMQQVGINAVSRQMAFGEIVNRINAHDFDLYILGWRIGGTDPDYMFSFWHCSNAAAGQNYGGFCNANFDATITASRAELDRSNRQTLIFEAQRILAVERPYDVLYYRTNVEGYRQDRFVNWTVSSGTIWGYWSLEGIRPPSTRSIRASISAESATSAGSSETVTVTVFDHQDIALQGANVSLSVAPGSDQGNLSVGAGPQQKSVYVFTDINGQVRVTYHAANADVETQVIISAEASHIDFPDVSSRSAVVRVFPPGVQFLSLQVGRPLGDRVTRGSSLPMTIQVTDQDRNTVSDAQVTIFVSPPGDLLPDPDSGTAQQMAQVTLAARSDADVGSYDVNVLATKLGYEDANTPLVVTVTSPGGTGSYRCPDGTYVDQPSQCLQPSTPALDVILVLAGIGVTALVAGVIAERKRRS